MIHLFFVCEYFIYVFKISYLVDNIMCYTEQVLVVNTDAEGRFSMADSLCEAKEMALQLPPGSPPPQLWTVATLTGHAVNAYGSGYSAVRLTSTFSLATHFLIQIFKVLVWNRSSRMGRHA